MTLDAYTDLATFLDYVRSDGTDSDLAEVALEAAARSIDLACGRDFHVAGGSSARYFTPNRLPDPVTWGAYESYPYPASWHRHATLTIDDVSDTTGLTVTFDTSGNGDYTSVVTAYRVGPANAPARQMPYNRLIFDTGTYPPVWPEAVKVEALWGWSAIPATIANANMIQASRYLKRREAPFGIAGSPDMGNELRLLAKLDPDVALMCSAYRRNWGAV